MWPLDSPVISLSLWWQCVEGSVMVSSEKDHILGMLWLWLKSLREVMRSSLRPTSIESVMPFSRLILRRPLLLLPPIPPSIRVFSSESTLCTDWASPELSSRTESCACGLGPMPAPSWKITLESGNVFARLAQGSQEPAPCLWNYRLLSRSGGLL